MKARERFWAAVTQAMEEKGWTIQDLAKQMGGTYSRWRESIPGYLDGTRNPHRSAVDHICKILKSVPPLPTVKSFKKSLEKLNMTVDQFDAHLPFEKSGLIGWMEGRKGLTPQRLWMIQDALEAIEQGARTPRRRKVVYYKESKKLSKLKAGDVLDVIDGGILRARILRVNYIQGDLEVEVWSKDLPHRKTKKTWTIHPNSATYQGSWVKV